MTVRQSTEGKHVAKLFAQLETAEVRRFPLAKGHVQAPVTQGVYIIRDSEHRVSHVGRTLRGHSGLHQRLRNHLAGKSSFVKVHLEGYASKLREGFTYQYLEIEDARQRALVEHFATAALCPLHLGLGLASA